jgi:hypothetical protein
VKRRTITSLWDLRTKPQFMAHPNTNQTLTAGTYATVVHGTVVIDNYGWWTTGAANLYTVQRRGFYLVSTQVRMDAASNPAGPGLYARLEIMKNGAAIHRTFHNPDSFALIGPIRLVALLSCIPGDTITTQCQLPTGSTSPVVNGTTTDSWLHITFQDL